MKPALSVVKKILLVFLPTFLLFNSFSQTITVLPKATTGLQSCVLIKPSGYSATKKYPLYIFLHGVGGRGDGSQSALENFYLGLPDGKGGRYGPELPIELQTAVEKYQFVLLAPQISGDWGTSEVDAMITYSGSNLSIDTTHRVITGLSLGGGGVWRYISSSTANAKRFSCAIPICGVAWMSNASNVVAGNLGIWAFHASNDGTVNVSATNNAISAINALSPKVAAYKTIYPDGDHYIWGRVYSSVTLPGIANETVDIYQYAALCSQGKPVTVPIASTAGLVANAGDDFITSSPNINLDGRKSTGYGDGLNASWNCITAPAGVSVWDVIKSGGGYITGTAVLPKEGQYQFKLEVRNTAGAKAWDTLTVTYSTGSTPVQKTIVAFDFVGYKATFSDGTIETASSVVPASGKLEITTPSGKYSL